MGLRSFLKISICITLFLLLIFYFFPRVLFSQSQERFSQDELILKLKSNENIVGVASTFASVSKIKKIDEATYKIKFTKNQDILKLARLYSQNQKIEFAEPNFYIRLAVTSSDTYFSKQWALHNTGQDEGNPDSDIDAPEAWNISRGKATTIIAIIDSGVDINHPDLKDKIWINQNEVANGQDDDGNGLIDDLRGWDFVENTSDPNPKIHGNYNRQSVSHGTVSASIASASTNNLLGIAGVSWHSKIMPLRIIDDEGNGSIAEVVEALNYARNKKATVINMSFTIDALSQSLAKAILKAYQAGIIIVSAAGNEGLDIDQNKRYPICNDGSSNMVLGIAALNNKDQKPSWSNYGDIYIDVSAPGEMIYAAVYYNPSKGFSNYYEANWSGTSVATPHVSGLAALLKSKYPNWTHTQIRDRTIRTADNIDAKNAQYKGKLGSGRINAFRALASTFSIITSAGSGFIPEIRSFNKDGHQGFNFLAFSENFQGGTRIATGDVNGDGKDEIIVGAGPSGGAHVRVFDKNGRWLKDFWPFHHNFRGGVDVASGDVDGDGKDEIAISQLSSGQAWIKIYRFDQQRTIISNFNAFGNFQGGAQITLGDLNKDGKAEIIAGAGAGGGPHLRVFDKNGRWLKDFWPFHHNFRGGVDVASGDVDGDGKDEIAVSQLGNGEAWIKVYRYNDEKTILGEWRAYPQGVECGANVEMADLDSDKKAEILTGAGSSGGPHLRAFKASGKVLAINFFAYDRAFRGGVSVTYGKF